jgi:hypothetical protein
VLKIKAEDLRAGSLYASVGSLKALCKIDLQTGTAVPLVGNLNGPHGMQFVADEGDDE